MSEPRAVDIIPRKLTFSDQEAAGLLGVSERTLRRYKSEGLLGELAAKGRYGRVTYAGLCAFARVDAPEKTDD